MFNPIAPPSLCHVDFADAIDCSYQHVQGLQPATPEKIADCLASMRCDLLKIIPKWEQSGQGEGGHDNDCQENEGASEDYYNDDTSITSRPPSRGSSTVSTPPSPMGSLSHRSVRALQSRSAFLGGRPPHVLYFWEVVDEHQLLQSSLQRLTSNAGAADASAAPTTVGSSQRRQRDNENAEDSRSRIAASLDKLAAAHEEMAHERARDREQMKEFEHRKESLEARQGDRKRKFDRTCELRDLARQYRRERVQLDDSAANFAVLRNFYNEEITSIEEELLDLVDRTSDD